MLSHAPLTLPHMAVRIGNCPERILTVQKGFHTLGLDLDLSFFASWWQRYSLVIQGLF